MAVTSILDANALTTYAAAKAEIQAATQSVVADDVSQNAIERIINAVSDAVVAYCDRPFRKISRAERFSAQDGERLILACTPIATSPAPVVTLDGVTLDSVTIEDAQLGFIRRPGGFGGAGYGIAARSSVAGAVLPATESRVLEATYTGGYVTPSDAVVGSVGPPAVAAVPRTLPWDIEHAVLIAVCVQWRWMRSGYTKIDAGEHNTAIGRDGGLLPDQVLSTLNRYRRAL